MRAQVEILLAKEISKKDRDVLRLFSQGKTDLEVCRMFGLLPDQLDKILVRATKWSEACDLSTNDALMVERALRMRSENTARSIEARFYALLDASPEAVMVVNALTGQIRQVNDNAAKLFGYAIEVLVGLSMEELVPSKFRAIHPAYRVGFLSSVRKRQMGYHPPIFAVRGDGTEIEIAIALTATTSNEDVMVVCTEFARWTALEAAIKQHTELH